MSRVLRLSSAGGLRSVSVPDTQASRQTGSQQNTVPTPIPPNEFGNYHSTACSFRGDGRNGRGLAGLDIKPGVGPVRILGSTGAPCGQMDGRDGLGIGTGHLSHHRHHLTNRGYSTEYCGVEQEVPPADVGLWHSMLPPSTFYSRQPASVMSRVLVIVGRIPPRRSCESDQTT